MSNCNATTLLFGSLFWFVGLSSWLTITALFSELSLMIIDLPEKYEIFSTLALIIQLANVIPLIYSLCIPKSYKTTTFIQYTGYIIISFSFLSIVYMAYFYQETLLINNKPHSIMLFLSTFCASTCDCMTSMVYWVWVSLYPSQYIAFLSAGEPSSGIVAAILIWTQQLNINIHEDKPRFSVRTYLLIIASLLPLSLCAFFILNKLLEHGYFETEQDWIDVSYFSSTSCKESVSKTEDDEKNMLLQNNVNIVPMNEDLVRKVKLLQNDVNIAQKAEKYNSTKWVTLVGIISAIQNGALPAISSYALISYSSTVYIYAITISNILKPLVAVITAYFPNKLITNKAITIFCICWCLCTVYVFYVALESPNPIGKNSVLYRAIVITLYVLCHVMLTLSKTCVIMMVKKELMFESKSLSQIDINLQTIWDRQIGGVMERIGVGIQAGSFVGALLLFIMINDLPFTIFHN